MISLRLVLLGVAALVAVSTADDLPKTNVTVPVVPVPPTVFVPVLPQRVVFVPQREGRQGGGGGGGGGSSGGGGGGGGGGSSSYGYGFHY